MYYILVFLPIILILSAQKYIDSVYKKNKLITTENKLTGKEVAELILSSHNIKDVKVVEVRGILTDHFDPRNNTLALSTENFNTNSISSVAISAHECGHVVQHKENYLFLKIRSLLVPIVNFSSRFAFILLMIGFFAEMTQFVTIGIILLCMGLVFQLVTLPVEFDASKKAKKILIDNKIINKDELEKVNNVLTAAALTYVAGFVSNLLQILRLVMSRRD